MLDNPICTCLDCSNLISLNASKRFSMQRYFSCFKLNLILYSVGPDELVSHVKYKFVSTGAILITKDEDIVDCIAGVRVGLVPRIRNTEKLTVAVRGARIINDDTH